MEQTITYSLSETDFFPVFKEVLFTFLKRTTDGGGCEVFLDDRFEIREWSEKSYYNYGDFVTKKWSKTIDDMPLIDDTKNADVPKIKDLEILRRKLKS